MIALLLRTGQCAGRQNQEQAGVSTGKKENALDIAKGRQLMTSRRNFLKGAAATGIAFCSCGMLDAARAQAKAPRLPVKIGGKRVLTVDAHSHCYFHEAINLMDDGADKVLPPVKDV